MDDLVQLIKTNHSGTDVHDIDGYDDADSLVPMWKQVEGIKKKMLPIMQNATDGVNLICFSQGKCFCITGQNENILAWCNSNNIMILSGGLVCRGVLETTPNHNVHTFVSLSSPQAGQFGGSFYLLNLELNI